MFRPTFDFAQQSAQWDPCGDGIRAIAGPEQLVLSGFASQDFQGHEGVARARVKLREGERCWSVLSHGGSAAPAAEFHVPDPQALLDETLRHWREWKATCSYAGPYREQVKLSARVLKMLTFAPSGALVAAPTTSLPEKIGGARNWDYRCCWLRDAALVLHALMSIGHHEAAMDFFEWLGSLCDGSGGDLQIMYRLDGGRDLPERELPHLAGYRDSAPVRVGNAASQQHQGDVYGHVLDAALVCLQGMQAPASPPLLRMLAYLSDQAAARWREPDHGLWEARCEPRHFVSSKLMCWVALDRAVRLAGLGKLTGDVDRWRRGRDAVRSAILQSGYDTSIGAFTQVIGGRELDASALLMPLVGFLPATDERMRSTVECIRQQLMSNGLVYRYLADDGVPGREASFALCSYWMVDNLALQGRIDEARKLFEHVGSFASDLGLLSEQIDPHGAVLLGNYPQGYTHLALIESALTMASVQPHRGAP